MAKKIILLAQQLQEEHNYEIGCLEPSNIFIDLANESVRFNLPVIGKILSLQEAHNDRICMLPWGYAAPEFFSNIPKASFASVIWSLGAIVYSLFFNKILTPIDICNLGIYADKRQRENLKYDKNSLVSSALAILVENMMTRSGS